MLPSPLLSLYAISVLAAQAPNGSSEAPQPDAAPTIAAALGGASEDVREFNVHLTTLASPFMEGRVPGSHGMEVAKDYVEFHFRRAGLIPAFDSQVSERGRKKTLPRTSFRQPFPLSGLRRVTEQGLAIGRRTVFEPEKEFNAVALGDSGKAYGPLVFVGYGIEDGEGGYKSYDDRKDLKGHIFLMLRFEPMDENGRSLWAEQGWSKHAGFAAKIKAARKRGAAAVLIANTPGADDPRVREPLRAGAGGRPAADIPVMMLSTEAGERLVKLGDRKKRSLMDLRQLADAGTAVVDFKIKPKVEAKIEKEELIAENVGGLLEGRGALADELVVIGAHLDHLGQGNFGSRAGPGALHPGADDNATGSAAVIMLAESLAHAYSELPQDQPARSLLLLAFSAEESGLNGSKFYAENPIAPMSKHALMINFDMIGRIQNRRLSVSGAKTGKGLADFVAPMFEASVLEIVQPKKISGASDHTPFMQKQVPILFGIIADFHQDYHTPKDVSWKINRVDAVHTIHLFHEIAYKVATQRSRFPFVPAGKR